MITSTPDPPFLTAAASAELENWGASPHARPAGVPSVGSADPMQMSGVIVWEDGQQQAGVWECTPGPSRRTLTCNEFVYVLYGRMTVIPDGGEPTEVGPGDTMVFPQGWTGSWQIHETMRKLYVLF